MPKRKFKKSWDNEQVEREKRWRKARMDSKRKAQSEIHQGLAKWQNADSEH